MSDVTLDELTEAIVFQIRQSRAIQLARVQAYLDGVVLAAEQVQDIRLTFLETPPVVTGWEAAGSLLLSFALDSTIAGKLLARTARVIFTPVLQMNVVFRALPKSWEGEKLLEQARRLAPKLDPRVARMNAARLSGSGPRAETVSAVLQAGARGQPGLNALDEENIVLYHAWLDAVIKANSAAEKNLTAAAKTVRAAARMSLESAPASGGASPAVELRQAAYDYASMTSLGIQLQHDRFETLVRGQHFTPNGLEQVIALCQWDELQRALWHVRGDFALLFEAIIWARMYGFKPDYTPAVTNNNSYLGIDKRLSDYWVERFAPVVAPRIGLTVDQWRAQHIDRRLFKLREYFWEIFKRMPHL